MSRGIALALFASFVATAACGGAVKDDRPPSEQLRTDGPARCHAACQTVVKCGLASECDCGCACPANATDCVCGACECPSTKQDTCESDCSKAVKRTLGATPACAEEMLALLDCVASATCTGKSESICKAEQGTFEDCNEQDPSSTPPPAIDPAGPAPTSPAAVACGIETSAGSSAAEGSSLPPGTPFCKQEWQSCSDGHSYNIECTVTPSTDLACTCIRDGLPEATFTGLACPGSTSAVNALCNWHLI